MTLIKTQVQCRGCQRCATIECEKPGIFKTIHAPWKCARCGSKLVAEIRKPLFQNKIEIRVKMVEHTKTLINMLNRRDARAKNHAKK